MATPAPGRLWLPLFVGAVLGPALQLQQDHPWPLATSVLLGAAALAGMALAARMQGWPAALLVVLAAAAGSFALCGGRAAVFAAGALDPRLEGRDLAVTGTVAAMPQRNDLGLRLRFEVETASDGDGPVQVPPLLSLAWYAGAWAASAGSFDDQRGPPAVRAGERWRLSVRLRAPHGAINPHGFDYELCSVGAEV